jgi:phospholipid-binding lipoprotein MlaA
VKTRQTRRLATVLLLGGAVILAGCSTIRQARGGPGEKLDPWENWNRKVFKFNEDLDTAVL